MPNSIFANARASAKQAGLMGAERLQRMIDSAKPADAIKILTEVNFGEGTAINGYGDVEEAIIAEEISLNAFIKEASPSERLTRFLLCEYDFKNAEAIMRAKYTDFDYKKVCAVEGLFGVDDLKENLFSDEYSKFGKNLAGACMETDSLFISKEADGFKINSVFTCACFDEMKEAAGKDKILNKIYSMRADAANISLSLRSKNFALANTMKVAGGILKDEDIVFLCEESPDRIKEKYRYTELKDLINQAVDEYSEGKPLVNFEKMTDNLALGYLKKSRYDADGYKPFILYCYYKRAELINVRFIISGLSNGIDKNIIRARVRDTYEGQNGNYR